MNRQVKQRLIDGLGAFSLGLGIAQMVMPSVMNRLIGVDDDQKNRAVQRWLGGAREIAAGAGLESRRLPTAWLWTRVAGDALDLGMLGAVLSTPRRASARRRVALATAAVAGVTVADIFAATANSPNGQHEPIHADARITVKRPTAEVYAAWRKFENLPTFMAHLESVNPIGDGHTRWRATGPAGTVVEWEAEIDSEHINEHISWRSVGDATVRNSGRVDFVAAPGGRGTEVRVHLSYDPPAGKLGAAVAKLFGEAPDQQIRDDLRRFKQVLEIGAVVRSEASPGGATVHALRAQRPAQPIAT
jgi:uncharacterized membrane protein